MAFTPEQQKVIAAIKQAAARRHAGPKVTKAALETGAVESNFQNLPGGDADSAGWRQERRSLYKNPTDLNASINRFIDEALAVKNQYGSAGDLAAAVQRPAAQYRGRYQQQSALADQLLGAGGGAAGMGGGSPATMTTTSFDQAGYDKARKLAILGNYLAQRNPNSPLLRLGIATTGALPDRATFEHTTKTTLPKLSPSAGGGRGSQRIAKFEGTEVPEWMIPALEYAREHDKSWKITSGVRTRAQQQQLWDNRASNPNPVARPGTSNHEIDSGGGGAVDVSNPNAFARALAGFRGRKPRRDPSIHDPVHFSATGR